MSSCSIRGRSNRQRLALMWAREVVVDAEVRDEATTDASGGSFEPWELVFWKPWVKSSSFKHYFMLRHLIFSCRLVTLIYLGSEIYTSRLSVAER